MTGEWIRVEDGYPKAGQPVLLKIKHQPEIIIGYHHASGWDEFADYIEIHGDAYITQSLDNYKVTHWVPLPEPPEE